MSYVRTEELRVNKQKEEVRLEYAGTREDVNVLGFKSKTLSKLNFGNFWDKISLLGTTGNYSDNLRRNIILSNQIGFVLFVLSFAIGIIVTIILPSNTLVISWFGGLAVGLAAVLVLNAKGLIYPSRLLLSFALPLVIVGATIHTRILYPEIVHEGSYYIPRYYMIGTVVIPLLLFSFEEKKPLILSLLFNMLLIILYNPLHYWFDVAPSDFGTEIQEEDFISISSAIAAFIIISGCMFLLRINFIYENRVKGLLKETEQKNEDIESSIRYAKRLQTALLPSERTMEETGKNLFILYKPKDIVSGDFYQIHDFGDLKILAVVDCTGHGVPGAFMSIISGNALRRAIKETSKASPDEILKKANELITEEFDKELGKEIRDGMDVSLCIVDTRNKEVLFAGTNQRIYYVEDDNLQEHRSTATQVSGENRAGYFDLVRFNYNIGGQIFLSTDGFPDQFGGVEDKKFGRKRIKETFLGISQLPVYQQGQQVDEVISSWMGEGEQTDDICVLGFKLV